MRKSKPVTFENSFASHPRSECWSPKNEIKPCEVLLQSHNKYLFNCDMCNHEFSSVLADIYRDCWCPYCGGQKICYSPNCNMCKEKSFASHEKRICWSGKNIVSPREVFKNTHKKYIFNCNVCNHEFDAPLNKVVNGSWCPYCSNKRLCLTNCNICKNKTFASCEKNICWSKKNKKSPREVFKSSHKPFIFDCPDCKHEFKVPLNSIIAQQWCPYCGSKKLCNDKNCDYCFNASFASIDRSSKWSKKNKVKPRHVFKTSDKKYIFDCDDCKTSFSMRLACITKCNGWCPKCKHKTEKKLFIQLQKIYPALKHSFWPAWCRSKETNRILQFDFVHHDIKIIFELDGGQHFKQVRDWKPPKIQQENDIYKMLCARNNGYSVIRLLQQDVWEDTYDWLTSLVNAITKITALDKPKFVFICNNGEYDCIVNRLLT